MEESFVRFCKAVARLAGVAAASTGAIGLLGWILDAEPLKAVFTGGITIKANAAACLILLGVALLLLLPERRHSWWPVPVGRACAGLAAVVGGLTLFQHLGGHDFRIDQLLFHETPGALATASPGRMGPPASASFLLSGVALLLLDARTRRGGMPSQWLALLVGLIALLPLIGYAYSIHSLYGLARYTGIALHTALAIACLATGLLLARPTSGLMAVVCGDDAGGIMARRLLPAAVLIPLILGWLRTAGERAGLFDAAFGRPILILSLVVSFTTVVWRNARTLSVLGRQRAMALESERAAREEAERAGRMKDEFLATLSHELRTPLNAVLGWSQILARGVKNPADLAEGLRTIERNAKAQTEIIGDLLDMSRIVSGKVRLDVQRIDIADVLREALETARPGAEVKGICLQVALDPHAGPIRGDPGRLQQVFWNLLSNAIKFTPRGGRVELLLKRVEPYLEVSVADTGEGIAAEFLPHVFDRFRQADASTTRRHGGLGLGLSIAKHLVELHGGGLRAQSSGLGKGSTFTVTLPLAVVPPEPVPQNETRRPSAVPANASVPAAGPSLRGVRVLVVDDEPDARALLRRLLEDCDAVVSTAASAAEALERLTAQTPDVLVSDIGMPGEDGYALIGRIRALGPERGGEVPAVALTAYARPEDRTKAVLAGYQHHAAKPVEPAELVTLVASLAGRAGRAG